MTKERYINILKDKGKCYSYKHSNFTRAYIYNYQKFNLTIYKFKFLFLVKNSFKFTYEISGSPYRSVSETNFDTFINSNLIKWADLEYLKISDTELYESFYD